MAGIGSHRHHEYVGHILSSGDHFIYLKSLLGEVETTSSDFAPGFFLSSHSSETTGDMIKSQHNNPDDFSIPVRLTLDFISLAPSPSHHHRP